MRDAAPPIAFAGQRFRPREPFGSYRCARWVRLQIMNGPDPDKDSCYGASEVRVWRVSQNLRERRAGLRGTKTRRIFSMRACYSLHPRVSGRVAG